jgi:hypothetical protein
VSGQDRDLDGAALLGLWMLARTAGSTAQMAADQRNAVYRYRAPYLDPETGRVAGDVLVTGVDVETAGWPTPCVFTKAGSCRWSEARRAYVPWHEPEVRVWGDRRLAVTLILCILAVIFGPGMALGRGSSAAHTTGVILIITAIIWVVLAWAIKREYRSLNRHDAEQDAARWQEAERRGHWPARSSTDPRPPAVEAAGTPEMSYVDFLGSFTGWSSSECESSSDRLTSWSLCVAGTRSDTSPGSSNLRRRPWDGSGDNHDRARRAHLLWGAAPISGCIRVGSPTARWCSPRLHLRARRRDRP